MPMNGYLRDTTADKKFYSLKTIHNNISTEKEIKTIKHSKRKAVKTKADKGNSVQSSTKLTKTTKFRNFLRTIL